MQLCCELPAHHELDGEQWHHDPTGAQWRYLPADDLLEARRWIALA